MKNLDFTLFCLREDVAIVTVEDEYKVIIIGRPTQNNSFELDDRSEH